MLSLLRAAEIRDGDRTRFCLGVFGEEKYISSATFSAGATS